MRPLPVPVGGRPAGQGRCRAGCRDDQRLSCVARPGQRGARVRAPRVSVGAALPDGAVITGIDGRTEPGETRYRADLSGLDALAGPDSVDGVGLLVEPVG
jgi:hypothetical protein